MDRSTMETISAAYTVYCLLKPEQKVTIGIDAFADLFQENYAMLNSEEGKAPLPLRQSDQGNKEFSENDAADALQKGMAKAEETLDNSDKLEQLLKKIKNKMKTLPLVGTSLSNVPTMFRLLSSYYKGEYEDIPRRQLIIIVSALSYLISPIDLVPDLLPVVGLIDDMAVISICVKLTKNELEKYLAWRAENQPSKDDSDI